MKTIDLGILLKNFTDYFKKIYKKDCYVIGIQSGGNLLINHLKNEPYIFYCFEPYFQFKLIILILIYLVLVYRFRAL